MLYEEYIYRQPNRVLQPEEDTRKAYSNGTYILSWGNVAERFGIFRCEPLKDSVGINKRHVMGVLRAAYKGASFRCFEEAIAFCRVVGIRVVFYQHNKPTYLV